MAVKFRQQLKGPRLKLKRTLPTLEMAEMIFAVVDANREHLKPWLEWVSATQRVEDTLKYLFDKEEETKQGKKIEYGIFIGPEYIGNIALFDISQTSQSAELGYWLAASHTRQGYMTEAVQVIEQYAFEQLKLNRLQIVCDERNIGSAGVAKKAGYVLEGTLRQNAFSSHYQDLRNSLIFSKLRSEYQAKTQ